MPQAISKENEFRITRSKVIQNQQDSLSTQTHEDLETKHVQVHVDHQSDSRYTLSRSSSSSESRTSARQSLGDVSNQYGVSGTSVPKPSTKRRPLGGDNGPLQQQRIIINPNGPNALMKGHSSQTGFIAPEQQEINSENISDDNARSQDNTKESNSESLSLTAESGSGSNNQLAVPTRLPQKRQATESSNNLVEKLHPSNNSVSYKKSRIIDYEWQDLDAEDMDDPLMASEYVGDIFNYFSELETRMLPDPHYLQKQKHLKPKMRSILVDWLVEMHLRFRLLPESLFLAINLMDRFMSIETVQIDKLQLLSTGSLFIAAKYEEVFSPSVKNYAYFTDGSYTEEEILQAEKYILRVLNFDLNFPNPMNFLRRISKADDYDIQLRTLGKYLLEITVIDYKFIGMKPSLCCASAMYMARLILGKIPVWNGNLIHYSGGYKVSDMKHCVELMYQFLLAPVEHDEFFKKYATRKFMKASILCRSWAKKMHTEGSNLFDEKLSTLRLSLDN